MTTNLPPPQAPPLFAYSPESLISRTEQLIACHKELTDGIVQNVHAEAAEFSNVLLPLAHGNNAMSFDMNVICFLGSVSPYPNIRNASTSAQKRMSDYKIDFSMREDVFQLVEAVYCKQKNDPALDAESRHYLEKDYKASLRMGLGLHSSERERFREIQKRLPELYIAFCKNLREEKGGIWLKPEELRGVPEDVLGGLTKGEPGSEHEGLLKLTFQNASLDPTKKYCTIAETRKKVFLANENKCNNNIALLKEAIELRDEAARLLGYPDHATFVLEDRMAKTPRTVDGFLDDLRNRLVDVAQKDLEKLKTLKRADTDNVDAEHYFIWDHPYYQTQLLSHNFQLDSNKIAEYFPLQICLEGMLNTFQELLGLRFLKIEGPDRDMISETGKGDDILWHPDVQLFSVWDTDTSEQNSSDFLGYLYFDLLPREGKFGHAANFPLQPGFVKQDGSGRSYPSTALVCNFSKPSVTKPSLLRHNDVVTLFHEFGHSIHNLVSQTRYACFHGTNTSRDFVETPAKMFENWCWIPSQLKALSKHWSYLSLEYEKSYMDNAPGFNGLRPEKKMPEAMLQSIVRTRFEDEALANLRLLHFSIFDMAIHQPQSHEEALKIDVSRLFNKLRHDICMMDDLGDVEQYHWANGAAILSHIMAGYDVGLYGYLWSEVYAADMFRTVFRNDPMNKEAGREFRNTILKAGGSRESMELLKEFLGRKPSTRAFYLQLRIT